MITYFINLQIFADAGSVVNTTVGYTNAHTGATTQFSTTSTLNPTIKTYYETELLENAREMMVYAQLAKKMRLPANHGRTVEWRRWNTLANADVLVESVIPDGQTMSMTSKTASIFQVGTYVTIGDVLKLHAYDDNILGATQELSASAAKTQETLTRDALLVNANVMYCSNINKETGEFISTPTSCATMGAGGITGTGSSAVEDGYALLTPDVIHRAVTAMKKMKVPPVKGGKYVAVIHPSVAYDLTTSDYWVECHKYAATTQIFQGEIGELHGCRFIEDPFAPVMYGTGYNNKSGTVTYATYMFGKEPFGIIDPEGGAMKMIVHSEEEIGGPINQYSTVGYKFETNGATVLYPERVLRIMSTSTYSAEDEPNYIES